MKRMECCLGIWLAELWWLLIVQFKAPLARSNLEVPRQQLTNVLGHTVIRTGIEC